MTARLPCNNGCGVRSHQPGSEAALRCGRGSIPSAASTPLPHPIASVGDNEAEYVEIETYGILSADLGDEMYAADLAYRAFWEREDDVLAAPVGEFPLPAELYAGQGWVRSDIVEHYRGGGEMLADSRTNLNAINEWPVIKVWDGVACIWQGHHRLAALVADGATTYRGRWIEGEGSLRR